MCVLFEHKSYVESRINLGFAALPGADLGAVVEREEHGVVAGDRTGGGVSRRSGLAGEPAMRHGVQQAPTL